MKNPKPADEHGGQGGRESGQHTSPPGYGPPFYVGHVTPCRACGNQPAYLARSLKHPDKIVSFEASGMPHRAICPGRNPGKRRYWQLEAGL